MTTYTAINLIKRPNGSVIDSSLFEVVEKQLRGVMVHHRVDGGNAKALSNSRP